MTVTPGKTFFSCRPDHESSSLSEQKRWDDHVTMRKGHEDAYAAKNLFEK
jgi:hypothetical protein